MALKTTTYGPSPSHSDRDRNGPKGSFSTFRPRFAGKCDRQSSDLTQFTSCYNFAVTPTTNHLRSSCSNSHLR